MERSAWGGGTGTTTVVVTVALSLEEPRSGVAELTLAELSSGPGVAGALTVSAMLEEVAPFARLASVQVTVVPPLQFQPLPTALTKLTPAGRVSLTLMIEAVSGPALLTLTV